MNDKLVLLLKFLKELFEKKYTGQLRLNFHEGNLSEKVEKKESIKLNDSFIPENWEEAINADIKSGKFSRSFKETQEEKISSPPQAKGKNERIKFLSEIKK